jgi:hypothetical protein
VGFFILMAAKKPERDSPAFHAIMAGESRYLVVHSDYSLGADLEGSADHGTLDGIIRIDPTLRGDRYVDTVIHEWLHALLPHHKEDWVKESATQITQFIFTKEFLRRAGFA